MNLDLSALLAMADEQSFCAACRNAGWKGQRLCPLVIHTLIIIR